MRYQKEYASKLRAYPYDLSPKREAELRRNFIDQLVYRMGFTRKEAIQWVKETEELLRTTPKTKTIDDIVFQE